MGQNRQSTYHYSRNCKIAYPSLVDARLPVMPRNVAEFVLNIRRMSRDRNRLRYKMWERGLAVFDGDGSNV